MATKKRGAAEITFEKSSELNNTFTNHRSVLRDKGHIGLQTEVLVICSKKKSISGWLTSSDKLCNRRVLHDVVIVECIFGRFCSFGYFF